MADAQARPPRQREEGETEKKERKIGKEIKGKMRPSQKATNLPLLPLLLFNFHWKP